MPAADPMRRGAQVMAVCNACRYCEDYCPVFPAMEQRTVFAAPDLAYLANLCHNCGECLYACQYAPPHEFAINVPRTLAEIRLRSYEDYCWPRPLASAFRRNSALTALGLTALFSAVMLALTAWLSPGALRQAHGRGDFFEVVPYGVMVGLFGAVALFVVGAMGRAVRRFWRDIGPPPALTLAGIATGLREAMTLRHLHATGVDCVTDEEARSPWRRWCHHATFYGFLLCTASTSVAAVYHNVFGWVAPYGYASVPVLLGTIGGAGLLIGPAGLFLLRRRRDPMLGDPAQDGLDEAFLLLLFVTSLTGLLLLALRETAWMAALLVVHLGAVLAFFVSLPYGKFMHGIHRAAALLRDSATRDRSARGHEGIHVGVGRGAVEEGIADAGAMEVRDQPRQSSEHG